MKEQRTGTNFDRLIIEALQEGHTVFAWQALGGIVEKCELKIKAYRRDYNEIELEASSEMEKESLTKVISGNRIINVYIPELSVSFFCNLKSVSPDKKIKLQPPQEFFLYERRKRERIQPSEPCFVSFEFNKTMMKRSIFDISLGGIAIILPKSDKLFVAKGKEFPVFILDLGGKKIHMKAECVSTVTIDRYKLEALPYGGCKISFRFTAVSKSEKNYLIEFMTNQILLQQLKKAN